MYKSPGYSAASGRKGSSIVEAMEILGEQGRWRKFDAVMKRVMEKMADPDVSILVTFEAIVASYYRCEFAKAAELLQKAFDLIPQTKCPIEHQAHTLYTMSAIKRREGKHQESDHAIHLAMQVIRHVEPGRNAGEVFYNCACLLAQVNSGSTKRDNKTFIDAKQNFLLAIDHFQRGIQGRVYTVSCGNKLRKAFIRLAMLLLDCSVDAKNVGRPISEDDLRMAANCLTKVESDLWEGITLRARCFWLMATAVLSYRLQQFSRATDCARTAYDIATSLAFQPEVQFAHNLMTMLSYATHTPQPGQEFLTLEY
ncbi:PREDICTED: uncharacterized protein LOC109464595 [Branchiostoma belcheri]|uniref:Uncharacterized protein LOC109464595 n=1 Tax=Branchiostoma belcheri TaxID=7741 RepID=A0A6P4YJA6_BRABE|nr:PREDICTED: uncharacterized protein LOC109464595 [Branchiostoma belcheri]